MDINRKCAFKVLMDIEQRGAYSNIALNRELRASEADKPSLVRELVYGVLENKLLLDRLAGRLASKGLKGLKAPELTILRMGIYQLGFMEGTADYAAVNESVLLAKRFAKGREGFVNAVLRAYIRQGRPREIDGESLSVLYSYSPWIIELWRQQFPEEELIELLKAGNETPPLTIRTNLLKGGRDELIERLGEEGISARRGELTETALMIEGSRVLESEAFERGLFSVQDESSQLLAEIAAPEEGAFVLDLCAAPGGKSLALAEKMKNRGRIIASDIYEHRLELIEKEAKRLGVSIIETSCADARLPIGELRESADIVLCDVPCSGLGVLRRKPEIKTKEKPPGFDGLPELQGEILETAAGYVKKGGALIYSSCTVNRAENGSVSGGFLSRHSEFEKLYERQLLPHKDGCDGFYICKFVRR